MSFTLATTIADVLDAMEAGAQPVAGGTDLVVHARASGQPLPADLVAIDRVPELAAIEVTDTDTRIGAAVTHHRLMTDPAVTSPFTALADSAALIGSPATRNVGTLGGNIMNASPAMDTGASLVVLDAKIELRDHAGSRLVTPGELWTGPGQTSASPQQLCTAVHIANPPAGHGSAYYRLEYRRAMEIAVVGAAASVVVTNGEIEAIRVALAAVAPTIIEVGGLDSILGTSADYATVADGLAATTVQEAASGAARPISDIRAGDEYRRHTVGVAAVRAMVAAVRRAIGETIPIPVNRAIGIGAAR